MKIAIVVSRFNEPVTSKLLVATKERLLARGMSEEDICVRQVPGAVEIPIMAQQFARCDEVKAVICLGAVIRGETDHYEYVCQSVTIGCQKVALKHNVPVIFGVLTTQSAEQALARVGGDRGNHGHEYADTALEMIQLMQETQPSKLCCGTVS